MIVSPVQSQMTSKYHREPGANFDANIQPKSTATQSAPAKGFEQQLETQKVSAAQSKANDKTAKQVAAVQEEFQAQQQASLKNPFADNTGDLLSMLEKAKKTLA
ncbi:hypothetical protein [Ferrimonas balearica]|uniref:hypothetical protein n=1 Tax=Ferrimonas balearica TaxID=44012 RepID=UPI001C99762C|nr:hypothetical protein [Ferrimonas balearica]MBY5993952.1 hypothetical protein [Ferrimonas balearica]